MSWSTGIRKVHRWTSIVFILVVVFVTISVATVGQEELAEWVYMIPLFPLALLALTGLYLLVLPYTATLRRRRSGSDS